MRFSVLKLAATHDMIERLIAKKTQRTALSRVYHRARLITQAIDCGVYWPAAGLCATL
jgi:hypothetical protein